jgi:hypothetical protein
MTRPWEFSFDSKKSPGFLKGRGLSLTMVRHLKSDRQDVGANLAAREAERVGLSEAGSFSTSYSPFAPVVDNLIRKSTQECSICKSSYWFQRRPAALAPRPGV